MSKRFLPVLALFLFFGAKAQQRSLQAHKITTPIKIDGNLDEEAWKSAPVATDFIQNFPAYGRSSEKRTEVKVIYDNNAIYVAAYMYDDPKLIRRQITSRDNEQQQDVDYFSVFFDTYNDKQNGFQFLVTSKNVQSDTKLNSNASPNYGSYGDRSWDAVWQSSTSIKEDGWVAEMRIPYISLRFSNVAVQTWGIQFSRSIRRTTEISFWNPVDPKEAGFINQFGQYTGITDVQPPLRLSLSPYVSGGIRYNPEGNRQHVEKKASGGMDVKYGINESFTIDATLIPDFGQVISDNIVNNLSPYEVVFQENRPFFSEGTELFKKAGLFYSRRVGATPMNYYSVEGAYADASKYTIEKNPAVTNLYNAIKLSGRNDKKLGIGFFNAVTAPMKAHIHSLDTKKDTTIQTEPLTNYNIIVLDKAFKGRSSVTFTNTNVLRSGMVRDANSSAFDWSLFSKNNQFLFKGTARYSAIMGYTPYSMIRYTPYNFISSLDTTHINGELFVKPYDGYAGNLRFSKVSGTWQYFASANLESQAYDINDLGYLSAPNRLNYSAGISYNIFEPRGIFYNYNYSLQFVNTYLYKPYEFSNTEITARGFWFFKNMWDVRLTLGTRPYWTRDYFEMRTTGYMVKKPWYYYAFLGGSTDSRKRLFVDYEFAFAEGALANNPYYSAHMGGRYRFSDRFTMGLSMSTMVDNNQIGFAGRSAGIPYAGYRDFKETSTVLSGVYNFTSRLNFNARMRHYWSKVNYNGFFYTDAKGEHGPLFNPGRDHDYNFNVFNVDAFLTWDFRPGSRIIFGWKNWLGNDYATAVDGSVHRTYQTNFLRTFDYSHGNEVSLRVIYFLDYNDLKKK